MLTTSQSTIEMDKGYYLESMVEWIKEFDGRNPQ